MSAPANAWEAADQAYQAHHFNCPHCISAGISRSQERCPDGQTLWTQYLNAGDPPHFTWLRQRQRKPT